MFVKNKLFSPLHNEETGFISFSIYRQQILKSLISFQSVKKERDKDKEEGGEIETALTTPDVEKVEDKKKEEEEEAKAKEEEEKPR